MDKDICRQCGKSHKIKNEGPLTSCELHAYISTGAPSTAPGRDKYPYAFGTGNRFQFREAR